MIGPNGAGKTSLFNVLTGIYAPDAGAFTFDGAPLSGLKPNDVAKRGIARTFQNIRLFANLTALENVMIGRHVRTHASVDRRDLPGPKTRAEEEAIEQRGRTSCSSTSASASAPTTSPSISRTATSGGSRSRARSPPNRSCSRSTSPPPE